jgi:hypothetical protein
MNLKYINTFNCIHFNTLIVGGLTPYAGVNVSSADLRRVH